MNLNEKIRILRKENGWTMQELADRAELSKGYISMLEKGENPQTKKPIVVSLETAQKLALAFNLDLETFLNNVTDNISLPKIKDETGKLHYEDNQVNKYLALVSYRKASVDKVIDREYTAQYMETGTVGESNEKYIHTPNISIITGRKSAAGETLEVDDDLAKQEVVPAIMLPKGADELVEITGDSMEPLINKGEKVYIRHQAIVENGEIAIVRIEEQGVTCKRVYKDNGILILKSENNKYDDIIIDKDEVVILAKVLLK